MSHFFLSTTLEFFFARADSETRTHVVRLEGEKFTTNLYPQFFLKDFKKSYFLFLIVFLKNIVSHFFSRKKKSKNKKNEKNQKDRKDKIIH